MPTERIVAVGLLTEHEVALLGPTFERLWPVEDAPEFAELLTAIDEADAGLREDNAGSNAGASRQREPRAKRSRP